MFEKFFRRWTCRNQFLTYRFLLEGKKANLYTMASCKYTVHDYILNNFFLNLAGRGLGRCHRSVALGALELGGVFLQRRLRGPGAPDGRVLRLGESFHVSVLNTGFVQVRRFMKIFRRFCKTQPCLHDFCIVLVLSVARSSIQWPIFELLRQARSSIICL